MTFDGQYWLTKEKKRKQKKRKVNKRVVAFTLITLTYYLAIYDHRQGGSLSRALDWLHISQTCNIQRHGKNEETRDTIYTWWRADATWYIPENPCVVQFPVVSIDLPWKVWKPVYFPNQDSCPMTLRFGISTYDGRSVLFDSPDYNFLHLLDPYNILLYCSTL